MHSFFEGIKKNFSTKEELTFFLSMNILSGIVRNSLYPLDAQIKANAIPVFSEVGSIIIVFLLISFFLIPSSIIAKPILSFTDPDGLKYSNLAAIVLVV